MTQSNTEQKDFCSEHIWTLTQWSVNSRIYRWSRRISTWMTNVANPSGTNIRHPNFTADTARISTCHQTEWTPCHNDTVKLDQCPKYRHIYFGNSAVTLNNQITATSLGTYNLLTGLRKYQKRLSSKICGGKQSLYPNCTKWIYLLYQDTANHSVKCKPETRYIPVQWREKVTLKDNCQLKSNKHTTCSIHTLQMESETKRWPFNWNALGLLFDHDSA